MSSDARLRTIETRLAAVTLVVAALFTPVEVIATVQMFGGITGVVHPGFVASVGGIGLSVAGALRSLRARPRRAPALLCAAHAWGTGGLWHALGVRYQFLREGGELFYGSIEFWVVVVLVALATVMFALSTYLTVRADQ
ncbi:MAG TPA: hypothetical protein VLI71_02910 [Gammaproteobacteria bacterium]|nr:hypothetical protein [Gammaproteobacteria bacterium]